MDIDSIKSEAAREHNDEITKVGKSLYEKWTNFDFTSDFIKKEIKDAIKQDYDYIILEAFDTYKKSFKLKYKNGDIWCKMFDEPLLGKK